MNTGTIASSYAISYVVAMMDVTCAISTKPRKRNPTIIMNNGTITRRHAINMQ